MSAAVNAVLSGKSRIESKDGGKKWVVDKASARKAQANLDQLATECQAIQASNLPEAIKAKLIADARAAARNDKGFGLAVARAQEAGTMDLIEVTGGFKSKQLSPNLIRALCENAEFVLAYLESVAKADCESAGGRNGGSNRGLRRVQK